ncbi:MAG: DUF6580 family putative transport protein [Saprospiraceae bacterium]
MEKNEVRSSVKLIILMIFVAALSRLLPHPNNFSPISAIALFGAAYLRPKWTAVLIPFIALWISDLLLDNTIYNMYSSKEIGTFSIFGDSWVYTGFLLIIVMGSFSLQKVKWPKVVASSIAASLMFFVVSNFGTWASVINTLYPRNLSGLTACYVAGIPFLWNTLVGDLCFTLILFGTYAWIQRRKPALERATKN